MTALSKSITLALLGLFLANGLRAELYAQAGGTFQRDGCVYVLVHIYDDQGTDTMEDDTYVGSGSVNIGDCGPGGASPGGSVDAPGRNVFNLGLQPVPVSNGRLTVDYKGKSYDQGVIKGAQNPDERILLEQRDLELEGKETIDLSSLSPGYYFIFLGNDEGEKAVEKFKIE